MNSVGPCPTGCGDPTPVVLARYGYGYDPAGNRTFEQVNDAVTAASHDVLNRLTAHQPGGTLRFEGAVSEAATVTVAGKPAAVDAANRFQAGVPVTAGTNTVAIAATDASGNVTTATYERGRHGDGERPSRTTRTGT